MKKILCGAPAREKRDQMVEMREERDRPAVVSGEVRADDESVLEFSGYASTFEPYEMYGGPAKGGWIEQIDRGAFDKTLRAKADLHLLVNHGGMPLARTKSGTLDLSVDDGGLKVYSPLDRSDPDVQRIEPKMRRKDMDEMSFAFRVIKQRWDYAPDFDDDPYGLRIIEELSLHKGDVSLVNFGANPTTSAELLSAVKVLAKADLRSLAGVSDLIEEEEARSREQLNNGVLPRAIACLEMLQRSHMPGNLRADPVVLDLGSAKPAVDDAPAKRAPVKPAAAPKPQPAADERADDAAPKKGMSLQEALARQGLATNDGSTLSLSDALGRSTRDGDDDPAAETDSDADPADADTEGDNPDDE